MVDDATLDAINFGINTDDLLRWVGGLEGPIVATSSFQTQSVPFLHLLSLHLPQVPVLFMDTGFHFPETLAFRDQLVDLLDLNVVDVLAPKTPLYSESTEHCCRLNKVEPLEQPLAQARVWLTGIRRDQTRQRQSAQLVTREASGRLKVCPMAVWTEARIHYYIQQHGLPQHPLTDDGYTSIGCAPCTRRPVNGDARSGRWADEEKTECGIHYGNQ